MTQSPSPERLAWAGFRNLWSAYAARPLTLFFDTLKLLIAVLAVTGYQFGLLSGSIERWPALAGQLVRWLPAAGFLFALLAPRLTSPMHISQSDKLRWLSSLPLDLRARKFWVVRVAVFRSLLISVVIAVMLFDLYWIGSDRTAFPTVGGIATAVVSPVIGAMIRSLMAWRRIFAGGRVEGRKTVHHPGRALGTLTQLSGNYVYRLLVAHTLSLRRVDVYLATAGVAILLSLIVALLAQLPQAPLVIGAVAAWVLSSAFQPPQLPVYKFSRSLPVRFADVFGGNLLWICIPLLITFVVMLAAAFAAGGGFETLPYGVGIGAIVLLNALLFGLVALAFANRPSADLPYTASLLILAFVATQLSLFGLGIAFAAMLVYLIHTAHSRWTFGEITR